MTVAQRNPFVLLACVVVVFAFAIDWRFRVGAGASFTLFEITAWIVGPVVLSVRWPAVRAALQRHWALSAWVAWVFLAGMVALVAFERTAAGPLMKNTLPAFWLFVALAGSVRSRSDLEWILRSLFVGVAINCILGLYQAFTGQGYVIPPGDIVMQKLAFDGSRVSLVAMGTFGHPNNFGLFISTIITLALVLFITRPKLAIRTFAPLFLVVALPALYFSFMKSGFLWIGIAVGVALAPRLLHRPWLLVPAIAAVGVAMFIFGVEASSSNRLFGTLITRADLSSNAFAVITSSSVNLIFGSDPMATAYRANQIMGWLFPHAHNGWINQVLFFGVPAGIFFVFAWFQAFDAASVRPDGLGIGRAAIAMMVAFCGMLILENVSTTNLIAMLALASGLASTSRLAHLLNESDTPRVVRRICGLRYAASGT